MRVKYIIDDERIIFFALAFAGVFIGALLYNLFIRKKQGGGKLTNFQSFLFGTGFVYFCLIAWMTVTFLVDYFCGLALQGYDVNPEKNELFFALFGYGVAGEDQYPLFSIDLNCLCTMAGGLVGGALLVAVSEARAKIKGGEGGLFYGYKFPKKSLAAYFRDEFADFRNQVSIVEYVLWWALRIGMIYFLIRAKKQNDATLTLLFSANLASTFVIAPVRLLFFGKLFFGKINYRVQTFINIFVFFGNFLGHGFGLNWKVDNYDKILHIVSGGVVVFIGCLLVEGTRRGKELSASVKTFAAAGFSCVVMVVWEIFEFFSDFYMEGSINQNWHYEPKEDMLFYRIFGFGAQNPRQMSVFDTDLDVFFAVIGCIVCSVLLFAVLRLKERKKQNVKSADDLLSRND